MIDPVLEKKIRYTEGFIKLWNQYYRQFDEAIPEEAPYSTEIELAFRNTKARICVATQTLRHLLGDQFDLRKDIMKVIRSTVSIPILKEESPIRINNIRSTWHQVFITLNRLQGNLKSEAEDFAEVTPFQHKMQRLKKSKGLKVGLILGFVVIALLVVGGIAFFALGKLR